VPDDADEPVPERGTDWGLPAALSVTVMDPVRVPVVVGVKVTLIVQLALTATELPQLLVCAKSPLANNELIVREALPVLERVTFNGALLVPTFWLANVSEAGEKLAAGAEEATPVPVPARLTVCGLPVALSVIVRVPP
jgi:hypothetical protein